MRRYLRAIFVIAASIVIAGFTNSEPGGTRGTIVRSEEPDDELDVTIVFLGLMTFDLTDPSAVNVYVPAINRTITAGDDNHPVDPHVAYLLAAKDSFDTPESLVEPDEGYDVYRYLRIDGETVTIPADQVVPARLTFNAEGCAECPTSVDFARLCWLSSMAEVRGGPQKKSPTHFAGTPDKNVIAAIVPITHGSLGARVIRNADGEATVWEFARPGSAIRGNPIKALAQEVHWTFKAKGTGFALDLTPFGSTSLRTVRFKPDKNNRVFVVIGNTMHQDTGPVAVPSSPDRDEHYSIYHLFVADNPNGLGRIPVPGERRCRGAGGLFAAALQPTPNGASRQTGSHVHTSASSPVTTRAAKAAPGGLNCTPNQWP